MFNNGTIIIIIIINLFHDYKCQGPMVKEQDYVTNGLTLNWANAD